MATDYRAAHETVSESLALLHENIDFDVARDEDPEWPSQLESRAILAVRAFQAELASLDRSAQSDTGGL